MNDQHNKVMKSSEFVLRFFRLFLLAASAGKPELRALKLSALFIVLFEKYYKKVSYLKSRA